MDLAELGVAPTDINTVISVNGLKKMLQHVVAPLKRQISEIAESNKAVEKQLRQELEETATSLNEAKRRITTLEKDMENKVSQNQLIAKTGPLVESIMMEKLKGSYRELEDKMRNKIDDMLSQTVTMGEVKNFVAQKVSHGDLEELLKSKVNSYEFKTHCQKIDAYLDDWQVALTTMRAKESKESNQSKELEELRHHMEHRIERDLAIAKSQIERDSVVAKSEMEQDVARAMSRFDDVAKAVTRMDDVANTMSRFDDLGKAMARMDGEVKEAKHNNAVLYEYVMQRFETVGATQAETPEAGTFITKAEFIKEMEDKVGIEEFVIELKKQLNKKVSSESYEELASLTTVKFEELEGVLQAQIEESTQLLARQQKLEELTSEIADAITDPGGVLENRRTGVDLLNSL